MTLDELYTIIEERKKYLPKNSYITSLLQEGTDRIIQKVGEESVEVIIAAKNANKNRLKEETADLLFHLLLLLAVNNVKPKDILNELEKRNKK